MRGLLQSVVAAAALLACGDNDPPPPAPPTPAPFGLDERPTNTSCLAQPRPVFATQVALEARWTSLTFQQPLYLTQAPGDDAHWYVVERQGKVRVFPDDAVSDAEVRDFASVSVNAQGEGGLLGFAFHPRWPATPEAFLSYTRDPRVGDPEPPRCPGEVQGPSPFTSILARFHRDGEVLSPDAEEIFRVAQPYANHDGGNIGFGPDGFLYLGLGDGGAGNDPCGSGQSLASPFGKMLRIDIDAPGVPYGIPADNPFAGSTTAANEVWSYGHRNPWRWSFDQLTGDLWVGDVGQDAWEEIDLVVKGGNYGWSLCEGFHKRASTTALCNTPGFIDPVVEHPRSEARSITGGYVYRGRAMPALAGTYIYGDFGTGIIWALTRDATGQAIPKVIYAVQPNTLVSFAQDHDGEIYTVQITGVVSKLVPAPARLQLADSFPQRLSETGCVDPRDPAAPAAGMIPYEVNSPLWSDGADKARYLAIPDGTTITVNDEQDWDLPIGSVVMKTFSAHGTRIETRLLMRHDDGGWTGYTYEWNDAGTDAVLLPAAKDKWVGDRRWTYPSRSQCQQCHTEAAGGTLGLETAQLNRNAEYRATNRVANQLATLANIGVVTLPPGQQPSTAPQLPDPAGNAALDARARSYLHANCSHCHRPGGGGQGTMDLRYALPLAQTQTCDQLNTQGAIAGVTKLLVPGKPDDSLLVVRVRGDTGLPEIHAGAMPPVAVNTPDPLAKRLLTEWIRSISTCP